MPRIGRQISHFKQIDVTKTTASFSSCMGFRSSLKLFFFPEEARTHKATVVLKNPSSADERKADKTIFNVCSAVYRHFPTVSEIEILNLFSLRATDALDVEIARQEGKDIGLFSLNEQNRKSFTDGINSADICIFGWGGASAISPNFYKNTVLCFLEFAHKEVRRPLIGIYRKEEKGSALFPFHPCYWPKLGSFVEYENFTIASN